MNAKPTQSVYTMAVASFLLSGVGLGITVISTTDINVFVDNLLWPIVLGFSATVMGWNARKRLKEAGETGTKLTMAKFGQIVGAVEFVGIVGLIILYVVSCTTGFICFGP